MMYGYGPGAGWMLLMSVLGLGLVAAVVWAVVRLTQQPAAHPGTHPQRETPREILDRRLAAGVIDPATYDQARTRLAGGTPPIAPPGPGAVP